MSKIVQLSEACSLALHAMILLARDGGTHSVSEIARRMGASEAHLAKVVQQLARASLVSTARGPKGGVRLARPAGEITYLEVYEAVEGRLTADACLLRSCGKCQFSSCIFGGLLDRMTEEIHKRFSQTPLSEGITNN